jgi:hypothetical protein
VLDKSIIQKQNMGAQVKREISIMKLVRHSYVVQLKEVSHSSAAYRNVPSLCTPAQQQYVYLIFVTRKRREERELGIVAACTRARGHSIQRGRMTAAAISSCARSKGYWSLLSLKSNSSSSICSWSTQDCLCLQRRLQQQRRQQQLLRTVQSHV